MLGIAVAAAEVAVVVVEVVVVVGKTARTGLLTGLLDLKVSTLQVTTATSPCMIYTKHTIEE